MRKEKREKTKVEERKVKKGGSEDGESKGAGKGRERRGKRFVNEIEYGRNRVREVRGYKQEK